MTHKKTLNKNSNSLIVGGNSSENQFGTNADEIQKKRLSNVRLVLRITTFVIPLFMIGTSLYSIFIKTPQIVKEQTKGYNMPIVLSVEEGQKAEQRYKEALETNNLAICSEFKGKEYKTSDGGNTSFSYNCGYGIAHNLKNPNDCLAVPDDYVKRTCLQGLAALYINPKYCDQADQYAREEVAKEMYSQAETDNCYFNINACDKIQDIDNRESCFVFLMQSENAFDHNQCLTFTTNIAKVQCLEMQSIVENKPELCEQAERKDDCYFDAVNSVSFNMGVGSKINRNLWCNRIKNDSLRKDCLTWKMPQ